MLGKNGLVTKPEQPLPNQLPGLDIADGIARLDGDWVVWLELIELFVAEFGKTSRELRYLLQQNQMETAHTLLHTLKGAAGNVSADRLQQVTRSYERAIKRGEPDAVACHHAAFEDALAELLDSADQVLALGDSLCHAQADTTPAPSVPQARKLLVKVAWLLRHFEPVNRDVLEQIQHALQGTPHSQAFAQLRHSIELFDYDRALSMLRELAGALEGDDK